MFKVDNINTRARCEICSELTTKTPEPSPVFTLNFEQISPTGFTYSKSTMETTELCVKLAQS